MSLIKDHGERKNGRLNVMEKKKQETESDLKIED